MSKIVLIKNVDGLGSIGKTLDVKNGYARNYLLPKGYALLLNRSSKKYVSAFLKAEQERHHKKLCVAKNIATSIAQSTINIKVQTGKNGKIFGSVNTANLAKELLNLNILNIDKRKIKILNSEPIKSLGTYKAKVNLYDNFECEFNFNVVKV